ncbi:hypothetical protein Bca101_038358 [Brassica carinata]
MPSATRNILLTKRTIEYLVPGDAKIKDGRSLNVSKQDIADILECAEGMVSVYLSLPRYNVHQRRQPDPEQLVTKDMHEDMIAGVYTSQERMMEDTNGRLDVIYYPIGSIIGWKILGTEWMKSIMLWRS